MQVHFSSSSSSVNPLFYRAERKMFVCVCVFERKDTECRCSCYFCINKPWAWSKNHPENVYTHRHTHTVGQLICWTRGKWLDSSSPPCFRLAWPFLLLFFTPNQQLLSSSCCASLRFFCSTISSIDFCFQSLAVVRRRRRGVAAKYTACLL